MSQIATDQFDREAFLERLARVDRVPGPSDRREALRKVLERGNKPVDAKVIRRLAGLHQSSRAASSISSPWPKPEGWHGSAFVDPAPGFVNGPPRETRSRKLFNGKEIHPCTNDVLRRLVDRTTFGFSWEELDYAYTNGYEAYLDWQLGYEAIDDSELDTRLTEFVTLTESPRELMIRAWYNDDYSMIWDLLFATVLRQATSKRQLYERVVEFLSDHLNIYLFKDGTEFFKLVDDREVIRPNPFGKFSDLLLASAKSPAMLTYLDGAFNFAWAPNQNYAREILELHTVGVDNFSQADMLDVARCFTGWTIDFDIDSPTLGEFRFEPYWHDDGAKMVLGTQILAGGGVTDGERVVDILCNGPVGAPLTANFLGRKMAVRFWGEEPPEALVSEIAQAYLDTDGEIGAMLRVVLSERWLRCAKPRLKRPVHLAHSMARAIPSHMFGYWSTLYLMDVMGQVPYFWSPPNGYPEAASYWAGHILPRWRHGFSMLQEQNEVWFDYSPFLKSDPEEIVEAIDIYVFGAYMPRSVRTELLEYLGDAPVDSTLIIEALGLAIASPAFQQY